MPHLVWFRSDLRTVDNTALSRAATASADGVVALFILAPDQWRGHDYAPARVDLILRTLTELSSALAALKIPLLIETAERTGDAPRIVRECAARHRCVGVHANQEYEVDESRRDAGTRDELRAIGVELHLHHDQIALPPGEIRTGEGRFYTVFTPFRKAWLKRWHDRGGVAPLPAPRVQPALGLKPSKVPHSLAAFASHVPPALWPAGETHARTRLAAFAAESIAHYKSARDMPDRPGTSQLSPYLSVGALSPRQCIAAALAQGGLAADRLDHTSFDALPVGPATWISELIWREFFVHVLVGFPRVGMGCAFQPATERLKWSTREDHFEAWCEGRTGIPIVDAAMRQLLATGWMHNRLRMVAAMFLTKNLFIDWRRGERFFMRNLVDGFFASNNAGWQWSASTGTDAAPYFRVFNPISQSRTYDPQGTFIRRWVPELAGVEGDAIHCPYDAKDGLPPLALAKLDYPRPIVDLGASRARAIAAFQALRT
ncbi:MAG: deoxyribodipyrimidine photo-lyase [Planctomycetota bacterium]